MSDTKRPTKEVVRGWLKKVIAEHRPIPDMKQIRRELGWELVVKPRR